MSIEKMREEYAQYILKPVMSSVEIVRGEGCRLFDASGKKYLDMVSGFGVSALGYGTPQSEKVKGAMFGQMNNFIHLPYYLGYNEVAAKLASAISSIVPSSVKKTCFCNSGSEGVEGAIRVVRKATGKTELVSPQMSFFGRTTGAANLTGLSQDKR